MRWRDTSGVKWRLRQQRLAWPRRIKPEAAFELAPAGIGDDPISLIIAAPFILAFAVMVPLWLAEFAARLAAAPVATALRLGSVIPYQLELSRKGQLICRYSARGRSELVALRTQLARH
ncbi:MAG: hypothetical protein JWN52_4398 [Actinomycetia bacterium]|nr:hypothetical protein [Actinomycetes bacterium]